MGSLTIPAAGLVYIDTPLLIYSVEKHPVYGPLVRPLWQAAHAGTVLVVTSELSLMEALILPLRTGNRDLQSDYERLLGSAQVRLLPLTQDVLREAARLRADLPALRTPDALHAATARQADCALFVTNDTGFRRVPHLPLVVLDDVLAV